MSKNIIRQVTLDRANRKKDKSISLTFITTLEQSTNEFMEIDKVIGDSGLIYFKSQGNLTTEEVKELESAEIEVEGKTKSQRLRNVLYRVHEQTNTDIDFNSFYAQKMEELIEHFKKKLN